MSGTEQPDDHVDSRTERPRFITGRLLAGRYEILERIGEGGTAVVFRARDHRLDRVVAVKVLRPQYGQDPDARSRFAVEARSAAALAASNIVPVYDFGATDDGSLFIVMRFIDGPSLRQILGDRGSLSAAETVDIGRQVALALAAAHEKGLVHRDVKPGNILLDAQGTAHLTDFGTVKALGSADDLTRTGMIFGTAAYVSPEQATGGSVGPATDVYALGIVLYEAIAGRPPFTGEDPVAVTYRHVHEPVARLGLVAAGTDPDLEAIVMQSLEKEPGRRPASAIDVALALRSVGERLGQSAAAGATVAVGTAVGATEPEVAVSREPDKETVLMPLVPVEPETAVWSGPAPRRSPGRVPIARGAAAAAAAPGSAAIEKGISRPPRGTRGRRRDAAPATALALLLVALAVLGIAVALPRLMPDGDRGGVADVSPTAELTPTSLSTVTPPAQPTEQPVAPAPTVTAQPPPTPPAPTVEPTPEPTLEPTPEPTPEPTLEPTPEPTPEPTEPDPTPTERPPAQQASLRIPDRLFDGDYDGRGSGRYHGRSASWVYGQGTRYHTMTARFELAPDGEFGRRAALTVVGLDGENERKNRIRIALNDVTLYEGPNPLPNDDCCGPSGPGNWGSATFEFSGDILRRNNELVVTNLEENDCTRCPTFVMVDYAELEYRVRPSG